MKKQDIQNWNSNKEALDDYSFKSHVDYRRQADTDKIFDTINNTDWSKESLYHNSVRVNGKNNIGRTIKMNNKLWHKLNS